VALNTPQWNLVRAALGADERTLYEMKSIEITNEQGEKETRNSFEPVTVGNQSAQSAFKEIEADVERLIQELTGLRVAERELRTALEEPGGAEMQRR
jgi:hypothetical protein